MQLLKNKAESIGTPLVISERKQENDSRTVSSHNGLSHHSFDIPSLTHVIIPPKRNIRQQCCSKENLKEQALLIATIASVVIGIAVGIALRDLKCSTGKER
jgi:hypothetical protein